MAQQPRSSGSRSIADRQLLSALRAYRQGDFSKRLPIDADGVDGQIAEIFNEIAEQANGLVKDGVAISRSVGEKGKINQRLNGFGLKGGWANYVESINGMVDDLTSHSAEMARVVAAVSKGDLTQTIDLEGRSRALAGDFLRHGKMVNGMVEQLSVFGSEVTRVAREVGVEGKLGAQAKVRGVSGTWKELTDNVNLMADNLTNQVRDIAQITTAVANGDLTKKITVEVRGEILALKNTINTMVDQLGSFADEVTRVAREVGTEGVLGGQAQVKGVAGTWRELTENVNSMANNLTGQVRNIATVTTSVANGDLTKKITVDAKGEILTLKDTINTMVDQLGSFADEVTRVAREVGSEGVLGGQAEVKGVAGIWKELTDNVNSMANNLTGQVRNIAEVTTAVAEGDLSKKITVDAKGEILLLKSTINTMVEKLQGFSAEVTRVARQVGTEGALGAQAEVQDLSGVWKELTDNVNQMADNLTSQVRNIAEVTTAVANGDLSRKITVEVKGEILALKNTINQMVDSLNAFASEVTRMAREVGTDGVLGGQAQLRDVSGIWKELTDNVNQMANNLTGQVRNIAEVSAAVAAGDLSKKITVDARGEILDLKNTVNTMVDQLNAFGAEVTQLARNVGLEGKLGGQAVIEGVEGLWKELTENVNLMASNLTDQVRDIAEVTTAVANGDLTRKIAVDAKGEIQELKNTINTMVDQLNSFASEVTRLARDVGVEGLLGGQADVRGVAGTWRDLTDNVNLMASNLTNQVRNISQVTSAVAQGDLDKYIVVEARGEILELKDTVNTMVGQLRSFAEEVTRVAREVGTEGKLGGQADVKGVSGTWRDLTDNVNLMASNLTDQVRDIAQVTTAVAQGDLSRKISVDVKGEIFDLKNTINIMVDQLGSFADEVTRVARDVGVEGQLGGQADVRGVAGTWRELTDNVNLMASNLTNQVRDIAQVTTAVAQGDLSRKITVEVRGEILDLKRTINTMVDQLGSFADEVTRVAREVGTEGILGGQAQVRGVSGIWQELTDNVNTMGSNLTEQVRGIALVVTAVANGDLQKQLTLTAAGEIATLVETINNMIVTLSTFADQVSNVARDVGVEGQLGGQADVPGAAGIWRDLTNNVNELADNLTNQVRAIGEVATAVTEGDLSRSITVEAKGEVAQLKNNINQMIATLAETTRVNEEQDWLKTNLAKFTRMLQGQRDLLSVSRMVLTELAQVVDIQHGIFYMVEREDGQNFLKLFASYAYKQRKNVANSFKFGEGLIGQCAREKQRILLTNVPPDYIQINSGLGEAVPLNIVVVPIVYEEEVKGVVELASFTPFNEIRLAFLEQLFESMGIVVVTIESTMRTDDLLRQSQGLTEELQNQQEELQQTNEELEEKARQLGEQKTEVERKNSEVEEARTALEEKAEQLALSSRYKSEFLANMSHELRTPLNSLLILSQQLAENLDDNLSDRQLTAAKTIHESGIDLLSLINEVLDLAKVESGTLSIDVAPVTFTDLVEFAHRGFDQVAERKEIAFNVTLAKGLPRKIETDPKRLQQILRNLLSNAFKFTEQGEVDFSVEQATQGWIKGHPVLDKAEQVVAFRVQDTGIGVPKDRQKLIFEAFQQADGSTSRKYGGTGLGLSISRELASLLGGEVTLVSTPDKGSVFTLFLPVQFKKPPEARKGTVPSTHALSAPPSSASSKDETHGGTSSTAVPDMGLVPDDRRSISPGDRTILIIEDDPTFAALLRDQARKRNFKAIVATTGAEGLAIAMNNLPDAITLDLMLPDMHGRVILDRLKHDSSTRHIPVHVISVEEEGARSLAEGAFAFLQKPLSQEGLDSAIASLGEFVEMSVRNLLVVEDDKNQRESIIELIGNGDVKSVGVSTGKQALAALKKAPFDCMVLDLTLPDISGFELLHQIRSSEEWARLPVIIYTGRELTEEEETELRMLTDSIIVKNAQSPERLLDETTLFLHRMEKNLPKQKQSMLRTAHLQDESLAGQRVMVVDDDIRNTFAITSLLEQHRMVVLRAGDGKAALKTLKENPDIDIVLMDIMMPEMNGYQAMRQIRKQARFKNLPIIALTAKAMQEDRAKCIEAGASDYITKPVDSEQLLSLLRVWLHR